MKIDKGSVLLGVLMTGVVVNSGILWKGIQKITRPAPAAVSKALPKIADPKPAVLPQAAPEKIPAPLPLKPAAVKTPAKEPETIKVPEVSISKEEEISPETVQIIQKALAGMGPYIQKEVGIHAASGMPQDHVQIDPSTGRAAGYPANYSASSKLGAYFPFLLKAAQGNPYLKNTGLKRKEILLLMKKALITLRKFQKEGEGKQTYAGLFPWFEMKGDGSLTIAKFGGRYMVPMLDNGQATLGLWAWAGDETILNAKPDTLEWEIKNLLNDVIDGQHYERLIDPGTGLLYAEWDLNQKKGVYWGGTLWTEWMIASYLATIQGHIRPENWAKFAHETFVFQSPAGAIDMPQGHIFSMHEMWSLLYLSKPMMKSKLAPLIRNYFYLHALNASKNNIPGLVATEYGPDGYQSAGIAISKLGKGGRILGTMDNPSLSTAYGSALGTLIDPDAGMRWTVYHLKQPGVVGPFGPVSSFTRTGGATPMYTADALFMTGSALAGGVSDEVMRFAKARYGKSEQDFIALFDRHANAILSHLHRRDFRAVSEAQIPLPPEPGDFTFKPVKTEELQQTVNLSGRLQLGHWHGNNVSVPKGYEKWKKNKNQPWVIQDGEIVAQYNITKARRFAWLGTPVTPMVINGAGSISFWVPARLSNEYWEIELKNNGVEIGPRVAVRTNQSGEITPDLKWKKITLPVTIPGNGKKILNYIGISVPDPFNPGSPSKSSGMIHLRQIQLHPGKPEEKIVKANEKGTERNPSTTSSWSFFAGNSGSRS